jgi:hypothetical protein
MYKYQFFFVLGFKELFIFYHIHNQMFNFFKDLLTPEQQSQLSSNNKIIVNDYSYDISSEQLINDIQKNFVESILKNSKANQNVETNYKVSFIINDIKSMEVSIFNREYIIELLESINKFKDSSIDKNLSDVINRLTRL